MICFARILPQGGEETKHPCATAATSAVLAFSATPPQHAQPNPTESP
jgi:hypothetical protein